LPDSPGRQIVEKWLELLGDHNEFDARLLDQVRGMAEKGKLTRPGDISKLLEAAGKEKTA